MKLIQYSPANENDCLSTFDSNVPLFFASEEREKFRSFLYRLTPPYYYFVVHNAKEEIVACAGMKLEFSNHSAMLRWDMVAREFQYQRIGTFLTMSRLYLLSQYSEIQMVNLHTSQHSYQFYEKMGFILQHFVPNGIIDGMDEYYLELKFSKEKIQELISFAKKKSITL
jgi:hypothetical protein